MPSDPRQTGPFSRRGRLLATLLYVAVAAQAIWILTHNPGRLGLVGAVLELLSAPPLVYLLWFRLGVRQADG